MSARLTIRLSPVERCELEAEAREYGVSISARARHHIFEEPQTRPRLKPSETRQLIKHLIGQLGRVGNNMNQIAFKLNSDQMLRAVDREELLEGIRAIKDMRALLVTHLLQRGPC